jgi:predicted nucleic acid-binding protein
MNVYVLDANIISYYLKGHENVIKNIRRAIIEKNEILIAPIAYYEVKRGLVASGSIRRLREFEEFCETFGVGKFDNAILDFAVAIYVEQRLKGRPTDDADIFIAAFCKKNDFTLVTHNTKHFEHLHGIKIADWTE